ncbi:MAG: hypothetical protein AB1611_20120 [bacterium]
MTSTKQVSLPELVTDIRNIYRSDPGRSEMLVRQYLEERLRECPTAERLALGEELIRSLESPGRQTGTEPALPSGRPWPHELPESGELSRLLSQLLGIPVAREDLSSSELLVKLTPSLTTIFDTLNQIVGVIDDKFLGRKAELETIRRIIGSTINEDDLEDCQASLKSYLERIKHAFYAAYQAFQQAARTKIEEILIELSPDRLEALSGGGRMAHGFKFGPLRKAELFESYREKYQNCQHWFESGRLMEELLREFEKACQKIYHEQRG